MAIVIYVNVNTVQKGFVIACGHLHYTRTFLTEVDSIQIEYFLPELMKRQYDGDLHSTLSHLSS